MLKYAHGIFVYYRVIIEICINRVLDHLWWRTIMNALKDLDCPHKMFHLLPSYLSLRKASSVKWIICCQETTNAKCWVHACGTFYSITLWLNQQRKDSPLLSIYQEGKDLKAYKIRYTIRVLDIWFRMSNLILNPSKKEFLLWCLADNSKSSQMTLYFLFRESKIIGHYQKMNPHIKEMKSPV